MQSDRSIIADVRSKLNEAENLLELLCRRHKTCKTCPLNYRSDNSSLPGDGDKRCLYHILSADGNGWNYGFRACRSCTSFRKGSCDLGKKEDPVDECVACESYEEDTGIR